MRIERSQLDNMYCGFVGCQQLYFRAQLQFKVMSPGCERRHQDSELTSLKTIIRMLPNLSPISEEINYTSEQCFSVTINAKEHLSWNVRDNGA
mmetsp:Transcript_11565/g.27741  ORF Transcript_11565/g.27741 Transcript_11565/m.27741 type:complete len:93 (-) Transcript_11565:281-559(-)